MQVPKKRQKRKPAEVVEKKTKETKVIEKKTKESEVIPIIEDSFSVRIVNSALESIDLSDYGFYVIVQQGEKFVGVDIRSDMKKIVCHVPIKGSSKTKEFEFTVIQFLEMLEKSSKAKAANKKAQKNSVFISETIEDAKKET